TYPPRFITPTAIVADGALLPLCAPMEAPRTKQRNPPPETNGIIVASLPDGTSASDVLPRRPEGPITIGTKNGRTSPTEAVAGGTLLLLHGPTDTPEGSTELTSLHRPKVPTETIADGKHRLLCAPPEAPKRETETLFLQADDGDVDSSPQGAARPRMRGHTPVRTAKRAFVSHDDKCRAVSTRTSRLTTK
ncbi:hypothetical protein AAVH_39266, partial [Aphelenchoides avenae]